MKWIVVEIGCIECSAESGVVGVFSDREKAESVAKVCGEKLHWWDGGQNYFKVFELPAFEVIYAPYNEAFEGEDS